MINQLVKGISKLTSTTEKVLPDVIVLKFTIVNAFIIGDSSSWVLVDTGLENSYDFIIKTTEEVFGKESKPKAIILTHGHFDHIGCVKRLANHWNVSVLAHELEIPYLDGSKDYPKPDPRVDEGLIAKMSPAFPTEAINLGGRLSVLPSNGEIPMMTGWVWISTPGHTKGHVSLFREKDKLLITGDAFTTIKQESFLSVITQREEVKGPPAYLTTNWEEAKQSVIHLQNLNPQMVLPSHGAPMKGEELQKHMEMLTKHFEEVAVPNKGKYV